MKALSWIAGLSIALVPIAGVAREEEVPVPPKVAAAGKAVPVLAFDLPTDAVRALIVAVRLGDRNALLAVVGAKAHSWLVSGDEIADREEFDLFLEAFDWKNRLTWASDDKAVLTVGEESWEFPAPVVRRGDKWSFDAAAGSDEIRKRRVQRNEFETIQALLAIVVAQREYAAPDGDGNLQRAYAPRFASSPGKQDGLLWQAKPGEPQSPLGPLIAEAARDGDGGKVRAARVERLKGYHYVLLTSQGRNATGGAYDYMVRGKLSGGFAVLAYPATYGNTGVHTFVVNHAGELYEKDLGRATPVQVTRIRRFDPDKTWPKLQ